MFDGSERNKILGIDSIRLVMQKSTLNSFLPMEIVLLSKVETSKRRLVRILD